MIDSSTFDVANQGLGCAYGFVELGTVRRISISEDSNFPRVATEIFSHYNHGHSVWSWWETKETNREVRALVAIAEKTLISENC